MSVTKTIRVGTMPGRINEFAVEVGTPISDVLVLAELSTEGYEVKVDGAVNNGTGVVTESTNLILLARQVKGNSVVRIGTMPGRINEFALDGTTTFAQALATAELSADGYEIKADGSVVADMDAPIGSTNLILLAKQVKGNK